MKARYIQRLDETPADEGLPYELNRRLHGGFLKLSREQLAEGYWRIEPNHLTTGPHPFQVAWETDDDDYVMVIDPWG